MKKVLIALLVVALLAVAGCSFGQTPVGSKPESQNESFVYEGIQLGLTGSADYDGDWVPDRLEFYDYGTNPLKIDTDGDGIDDFNELFTYPDLLNPLDPADAQKFIEMLPDVEARIWRDCELANASQEAYGCNAIAKRDPLVQWYANHTIIEWHEYPNKKMIGYLEVINGESREPFLLKYGYACENCTPNLTVHSAYYLTHGRKGICYEVTVAQYPILELMGYKCFLISGKGNERGAGHSWLEAQIDGRTYVVDFNTLELADTFYRDYPGWPYQVGYRTDLDIVPGR